MLKINLTRQAQKFLQTLPPKQAKQLALKIQELRTDPQGHDCQRLKGYPYFRSDIGEYRIIYIYDEETLEILLVDRRNDDLIYKRVKRL